MARFANWTLAPITFLNIQPIWPRGKRVWAKRLLNMDTFYICRKTSFPTESGTLHGKSGQMCPVSGPCSGWSGALAPFGERRPELSTGCVPQYPRCPNCPFSPKYPGQWLQ
eukprot:2296886-Amphidinium_carterae.1